MIRKWWPRVRAAWRAYRSWTPDDECPRYSPKMMIETLCIAQSRIGASELDRHRLAGDLARLQMLISRYERQRPPRCH